MKALHHKSRQINMLEGSLADKIILFAIPLAASSVLQQLFNAADLAVVGRFASPLAMAAVGSNAAVINLIICLFLGLSAGSAVVAGQAIGSGDTGRVERVVHTSILLGAAGGVVMGVVGFFVAPLLLQLLQQIEEVAL